MIGLIEAVFPIGIHREFSLCPQLLEGGDRLRSHCVSGVVPGQLLIGFNLVHRPVFS